MSKIPTSNAGWDDNTVIGFASRAGGGTGPRMNIARSKGEINAAFRSGNVVAVEKKYSTGNQKADPNGQHLTKVDREENVVPPPKISLDVGRVIMKGRQEKNLTQKDLGTAINEKPNIIADYEAGRAVPNQQILGKIERKLGIKLRGKDIGMPLGGPKKK